MRDVVDVVHIAQRTQHGLDNLGCVLRPRGAGISARKSAVAYNCITLDVTPYLLRVVALLALSLGNDTVEQLSRGSRGQIQR